MWELHVYDAKVDIHCLAFALVTEQGTIQFNTHIIVNTVSVFFCQFKWLHFSDRSNIYAKLLMGLWQFKVFLSYVNFQIHLVAWKTADRLILLQIMIILKVCLQCTFNIYMTIFLYNSLSTPTLITFSCTFPPRPFHLVPSISSLPPRPFHLAPPSTLLLLPPKPIYPLRD